MTALEPRLSFFRLSLFLLVLGVLITRLSLVFHEVVGHAVPARLFGAELETLKLFLFGGGYVRWHEIELTGAQELIVAGGGIAGELGLGALLLALSIRRRDALGFIAINAAALNLLHGGYYLAIGVQDGFGDGQPFYRALSDRRGWVSLPAAAMVVAGGFFYARFLLRTLSRWVPPRHALLRIGGALAIAAGGHLGLQQLELAIRSDRFFADRSAEAEDNRIQRLLTERASAAREAGHPPTPEEYERWLAEAKARPPLPFAMMLIPALCVALVLGAIAGRRGPPGAIAPPTDRDQRSLLTALAVVLLGFAGYGAWSA